MGRMIAFVASAAINALMISAVAAQCTSNKDIDAARTRWATLRSQRANAGDNEKTCRAYAASFYESEMRGQAAAGHVDGARMLTELDSVINAFKALLATKCGS